MKTEGTCVYFGKNREILKFGDKCQYRISVLNSDYLCVVFGPKFGATIYNMGEFNSQFRTIEQIRDWKIKTILDEN